MSTKSIDERIVDMQFNNRQFESGIKESLGSIDKLKKGLDFKDAEKSFSGLSDKASKFSLSGIADGVQTIASKFTALGIIGVTALANIANSAVEAGKKIVASLTIDPIMDGFKEYELVLNAVQTTMAGTGKTMAEVEEQLKRLDKYADDTVYSTSDMLSNLPKFTNAGIDLDKAVTAMIGIANATALAGGDASKAAIAFYNLGQSIGTGWLTRMDYNSINNAGIATMEWKNRMVEAAIELGKLEKAGEDTYKIGEKTYTLQSLFIDGLQHGWASSDVLMQVFSDYGDVTTEIGKKAQAAAQDIKTYTMMMESLKATAGTGWKDTWQLIFGDLEEAKVLWTGLGKAISDVITESAEARNGMLQIWKDEGGRDSLIKSFWNLVDAISAIVKPIREAFQEIFPPMTGERLADLTKSFEKFTEKLKIGDDTAAKLKSTFKGFFAVISIVKELFSALARGASALLKFISPAIKELFNLGGSLGDWLVGVDESIKANDFFMESFEKIKDFVSEVSIKVSEGFGKMVEAIEGFTGLDLSSFDSFIEGVRDKFQPLEAIGNAIKKAFEYVKNILKKAGPALGTAAEKVGEALSSLNLTGLVNLFATGGFAGIIVGIKNLIDSFKKITDNAGGFLESITDILDGVRDCLTAYQNDLKAGTLLKIAAAIAILAGALFLLASVDTSKLGGALVAITTLFGELFGSMAIFQNALKSGGFKSMLKVSIGMILMSVAVLLLASAVSTLAEINWKDMTAGLLAVGGLMAMLVASAKLMSSTSGGLLKSSIGLIALGIAVKLLASSVADLAKIDLDKLINGMLGLMGILAMLSLFMLATKSGGGLTLGDAAGLIAVSIGVKLISDAIIALGTIDPKQLGAGLAAITLVLAELFLFVNSLNTGGGLISTALGIAILGASLGLFADAVERFGSMNLDVLTQGLVALAAALLIVVGAMNLMPPNMLGAGIGMLAVAAGLILIAKAMEIAGGMQWDEIARGLVALGGALLILVVAVNLMTGALAGAAALLIVSVALVALAFAMQMLGSMSLTEIGLALLTIAGVLAVFGAAALLLTPVIPSMLALAAALLLLGVGLLVIGAASIVLGVGLGVLAGAGTEGIEILLMLAAALLPLTLLAPGMLLVGVGLLILAVGLLAVGAALTVLGLGLGILMVLGPAGNQALLDMANTAAQIAEFAVELLAAGAALLVFGAGALVAGAGALIAGVGILVLAAGMAELAKVDLSKMEGISKVSGDLLLMSGELLLAAPGLIAGGAALVVFGSGAQTTGEGLASITQGMLGLMIIVKAIPDDISEATNAILDGVNNLIAQVTSAISTQEATIVGAIAAILSSCVSTIQSYASAFSTAGANVVDGFISGIQSNAGKAAAAAAEMAKAALDAANKELQIKSPSRAFGETAKNSVLGFVNKFKEYTPLAMAAASDMGSKVLDPVFNMSDSFVLGAERAGAGLQRMAEKAMGMTPTIVEEKDTTVRHTFDTLHVEGVNDKGEFVQSADYAVEKMLTAMMRRQSRV